MAKESSLLPWRSHGRHDQLTGPDVPEADRVPVVLKLESAGTLLAAFLHRKLGHDPVVENGDRTRLNDFPVGVLLFPDADDVVSLPLAGSTAGIHERDTFQVERGSLPVGIGIVLKGIEDLDFGIAADEDSAVPATLTIPLHLGRGAPFDVPLAISFHLVPGLDHAGPSRDLHEPVLDEPLRGIAPIFVLPLPFRKIGAVEKDEGVGRGGTRFGFSGVTWRGDGGGAFRLTLLFAPAPGIGNRDLGMKGAQTDKKGGGKEMAIVHGWVGLMSFEVKGLLDHSSLRSDQRLFSSPLF